MATLFWHVGISCFCGGFHIGTKTISTVMDIIMKIPSVVKKDG
jgi:hypothetical protein